MVMKQKFSRAVHWFVVLTCAASGGGGTFGATYSLRDLGPLVNVTGFDESRPNAVAADGTVVGANALDGFYRAFRIDGGIDELGTLGGGESIASDINRHGLIVGYSHTVSDDLRAFLWTEGGTDGVPNNPEMRDLGTLGGAESQAYAINDSNQVTGYAQTDKREHAFIYRDGVMVDIGDSIGGLPNSFGFDINEAGHVAGAAYNAGYSAPHAFLYDGQMGRLLGDLSGGESFALGLNDDDHVVGYSSLSDGTEHAFLYQSGVLEDLGTLGGQYSYAFAINNAQEVVGGSYIDAQNTAYHAFIWREGVMEDLNAMLDSSGDGWLLIEARAINARGQIAGVGWAMGGERGFLLTPGTGATGPRITDVQLEGSDVAITFLSTQGETYALESTIATSFLGWSVIRTGLAGTGDALTVTHAGGAGSEQRFYRVARTSP